MEIDILDPGLYVGDPYPTYRWLREHAPLYRDERNDLWIVSRYEDVVHVSRHPKIFCSGRGVTPDADSQISIITLDEPRHTRLRKLVNRGFTPRMVGKLEPRIREIVRETIDAVASKGCCDFVESLAVPLPMWIIAELIGIDPGDRERFRCWSDTMIVAAGQNRNPEIMAGAGQAFTEFMAYLDHVFEDRAREPRDDLVSILLAARQEGVLATDEEELNQDELRMFMVLLLVAGNETTRNSIAGGMLALMENPGQRRRLAADPALWETATDELIRWVTPIVGFRRTVTRETELHGRKLREGDRVLMLYQSANRDPEVFEDPDALKLDRSPNPHLAFGIGNHFCLGANLARLETRIMLQEILRRLPDMRLGEGGVERLGTPLVRGIRRMDVVFTPAEA